MGEAKIRARKAEDDSLILGWVHPGHVSARFMDSVIDTLVADARRGSFSRIIERGGTTACGSGPRIANARNMVVQRFLLTEANWLLMIDTDMVFRPHDVQRLIEAADPEERPIVGGLCFGGGRSDRIYPTMYRLVKPEDDGSPVQVIETYPSNGLCGVDATGAAFLLMHRAVLEKMGAEYAGPAPWFVEGTVYHGLSFGEDWAFCMRAKQMGYPVFVHTGVKIGHEKPLVLDELAFLEYKSRRDAEELRPKLALVQGSLAVPDSKLIVPGVDQ